MRNKWWARTLRIVGIVLMSLTAAFTILGGAGTSCVALNPTGWGEKFAPIAKVQWMYILFFVLVTLAIGVMGVRAVVLLVRGAKNAWRYSVEALLLGVIVGGSHVAVSRFLRGSSMPVDMVVYITVLTLIVFLLFRIPAIWAGVNYAKPAGGRKDGKPAAAIALALSGVLALTIQFIMAPTHTLAGVNWADAWHLTLTVIGLGLILAGAGMIFYPRFAVMRRKALVGTK